MCRFAAYLGPPRPLSTLVYDPPRGLETLAYDPREMQSGTVNVDGTGIAWWDGSGPEPLRYVTESTPWADPNLPRLAPRLRGNVQIAAVRSATPGIPFGAGAVAPFTHGRVAFAHNGWLGGFRDGVGRDLMSRLPDAQHRLIDTTSDSVVLFATFLAHLEKTGGLADAATQTIADAVRACVDAGQAATLNLLVSDGTQVVAVRTSHERPCNSLYLARDEGPWTGATVLASEPLDPAVAWTTVADHRLVRVTADDVTDTHLDL